VFLELCKDGVDADLGRKVEQGLVVDNKVEVTHLWSISSILYALPNLRMKKKSRAQAEG